jgi:type I restriction enzyme S subunit
MELRKGYKHTYLGAIPDDWVLIPIGDLFDFQGGSQPPRYTFIFHEESGYIRLLQIRDYKTDNYASYIPIKLAKRFCSREDIMIGRYGPPIFQILNGKEGSYNVALMKAVPTDKITKLYGWHILKQEKLFDFVEKLSQRSSGQTGVDLAELRKYIICLPTKSEQTAIATALSDTDVLIANLEKLIEKKRAIKLGAMQQLLKPKEGWKEVLFKDIVDKFIDYRGVTPKKLGLNWGDGNIPALSANNVQMGFIDFDKECYYASDTLYKKWMRNGDCNQGDILMTMEAPLGNIAYIPDNKKYILSQRTVLIRPSGEIDKAFFRFLLMFDNFQNLLLVNASGSTAQGIQRRKLENLTVYFPKDKSEQLWISQILSDFDMEISALEAKLSKYKLLKQGMMYELLTGKTRLV